MFLLTEHCMICLERTVLFESGGKDYEEKEQIVSKKIYKEAFV